MRIAINTRFLLKHKMEGFGWFTFETVKRMVINHPEHHFYFFFDRKFDEKFVFAKNVTPIILPPQARHPILFKLWFNYAVTWALKKYKIDLFFSPDGYLSLRTKIPQIGVIHDINFEHFPEDIPPGPRKYLQHYFPLFAKKAVHLITVSHFSKNDIATKYNIKADKITVAHNGASDLFKPITAQDKTFIQEKFANGRPFFLFVGALHPRKNIKRLLEAYSNFITSTQAKTQLLIVGEPLWHNTAFSEKIKALKLDGNVHFTGHLKLEDLTKVMAAAHALTFVSYFEGFGIPIVEAMQAGTPVLAGDRTALPEVAGNAALYVDPYSIESISAGLERIDSSEDLRNKLIKLGFEQAKKFSWDKTAAIIWEQIQIELGKIKN
jgi:glycosyltransferase involved in cell wall biosynthesis